jgi:hypothetical protein
MSDLMQTSQNINLDTVGDDSDSYKMAAASTNARTLEGLLKDYGGTYSEMELHHFV